MTVPPQPPVSSSLSERQFAVVRIVSRLTMLVVHAMVALLVVGMLGAAGLAWRLSVGPMAVPRLTETVEPMLASLVPLPDATVTTGAVVLAWDADAQGVELQVLDVVIQAPPSGPEVFAMHVRVSQVGVTLSIGDLLLGAVRPRRIELDGVRATMISTRAMAPSPQASRGLTGDVSGMVHRTVIAPLQRALTEDSPLGRLRNLLVRNGALTLRVGPGNVWSLRDMAFSLGTGAGDVAMAGSFALAMDRRAPQTFAFGLEHGASFAGGSVLRLATDGVRPMSLAALAREVVPDVDVSLVQRMDLSLRVQAEARLDAVGDVEEFALSLDSGPGTLDLAGLLDGPVTVQALHLHGAVDNAFTQFALEEARVVLPEGLLKIDPVTVPLHFRDGLPVLDAPRVVDVRVEALPVSALMALWPKIAAPNARGWVMDHMEDGLIPSAHLALEVASAPLADGGGFLLTDFTGTVTIEDARVHYLRPMPPLERAAATLSLGLTTVEITPTAGEAAGLTLEGGRITFTKIDEPRPQAVIDAVITGPLQGVMTLLDSEPLGYLDRLDADLSTLDGMASINLGLAFPLLFSVRLEDLVVAVQASAKNVALADVVAGLDLTEGTFDASVTTEALRLEGSAFFSGAPVRLVWDEPFTLAAGPGSRYRVNGVLNESLRAALLGDQAHLYGPLMDGAPPFALTYTERKNDRAALDLTVDAQEAIVALPWFGVTKPMGAPGTLALGVTLRNGALASVDLMDLDLGDAGRLEASAQAKNGAVVQARAALTGLGRNTVTLDAAKAGGRWAVEVRGSALDADALLSGPSGDDDPLPDMDVSLALDRLWLAEAGHWDGVEGTLSFTSDQPRRFRLAMVPMGQGAPCSAALDDATAALSVRCPNAGPVVRSLGITDSVRGGVLIMDGTWPAEKALEATLRLGAFNLRDAPLLAQVLNIAALTGIVDALTGQGIAFSSLTMPLRYDDGVLSVKEGRFSGNALGVTVNGTVDTDQDQIDLTGTLVPAYSINSILGNIPLLGKLFVPEQGGGVFAASYRVTGPVENPSISVNPLTALAPGFLRDLFGGIIPPRKPKPAPSAPPEPAPAPNL